LGKSFKMAAEKTLIISNKQIEQKINRIAYEIYEHNFDEKEIIVVGIANRGYVLATRICEAIKSITPLKTKLVALKINKRNPHTNDAELEITEKEISGKVVVLVDDVLNTGRTLAYGVKHLLDFPLKKLITVVLVNRRHRKYPVRADFVGTTLATTMQEHISVVLEKGKEAVNLT